MFAKYLLVNNLLYILQKTEERLPFSDLADGLMRNFIFKKVCKVMSHFYSMIID